VNLAKKMAFVNHYSFHLMDPEWGHVTIKMAGHPPFAAQVILNGHEYVAAAAQKDGIGFTKQGNRFTAVAGPAGPARIGEWDKPWEAASSVATCGSMLTGWVEASTRL